MTLRLTIISPPKVPPGFEQSVTLTKGAVTIGRAPENDLVLADPSRLLSKRHCTIAVAGGGYALTDTSANGVFVNGSPQRVPRDQSVPISPGDVIQLGDYEVRLDALAATAPRPAAVLPEDDDLGGFVPPLPGDEDPVPDEEFDLGFALGDDDELGISGSNPFADAARLLRETTVRERPDFGIGSLGLDDDGPGDTGESLLPHGPEGTLYAKAVPGAGTPSPARSPRRETLNPFEDDDGPDWDQPPMPDTLPAQNAQFTPPAAKAAPPPRPRPEAEPEPGLIPDDWDLDESEFGAPPPQDDSPFLSPSPPMPAQPVQPPPARPQAAPPPPPRPAPPASPPPAAAGVADAAAMRAFLAGAGLGAMRLSDAEATRLLNEAGRAFRALVAGLQEALATRAEIKEELDVSRTMIGATSNNPLKLELTVDEGVVAMLRHPGPGFLPPVDAINQGFRDVQAHQMATMAAMHLALRRLLEKFDPDALARRMDQTSLISALMPGARKSKYWEVYCDFYASIAGDAESEFHEFFTREFSKAYEEQARKLK